MYNPINIFSVFAGSLLVFAAGCGSDGDKPAPFDDGAGEFTATESGLKYRVTREGDGENPKQTDGGVLVHYRGMLADGSEFESTYKRRKPATIQFNTVIAPVWIEGIQFVKVGGMIELIVPPNLAYGRSGVGQIPPNATLYYTVELLELHKASE